MRIERMLCRNLTALAGDMDWTFPEGPVVLLLENQNQQKALAQAFPDLLYNPERLPKAFNNKGCLEIWLSGELGSFHIRREFCLPGEKFELDEHLEIKDQHGQKLSLPEKNTMGEFLLRINLRAFRQGVLVEWPENNTSDNFWRRVRNMRMGGEEGLSFVKVQASLTGAQKRLQDQAGTMQLIKAEYDALRQEWEAAHRNQEEERLLLIEIKKLQEREKIITERIAAAAQIQERLAFFRQNQDYRELRQLQGEIFRLKDNMFQIESALTALTSHSLVDWSVIENLREDCLDWAFLQDQVERITYAVKRQALKIQETKKSLQASGYRGFSADDIQYLCLREEESQKAQAELDKLAMANSEFENMQSKYQAEITKLQSSAINRLMDGEKNKIEQKEKRLEKWRKFKASHFMDRVFQEKFKMSTISERLSSDLSQYYQKYNAANYAELLDLIKQFRDQELLVKQMHGEFLRLQEKVQRQEYLRKAVYSHSETLSTALTKVKASDFGELLQGWEDYLRQKSKFSKEIEEQRLEKERLQTAEKKLAEASGQLRDKLGNWGALATNRDEALAEVLKAAGHLRAKDETEREINDFSERFKVLLGDRIFEDLAKILEPLADLEREMCLSTEERRSKSAAKQNELQEIRCQLQTAQQHLQSGSKLPNLADLELKIEKVRRRWIAYVDLQQALDEAETLLEKSWQEWHSNYGKVLDEEKQWIFKRIFSPVQEASEKGHLEALKHYFAYRMAVGQLVLRDNSDLPLIFFVQEMNQEQSFWETVTAYLQKISLSRQIILVTTDRTMLGKLMQNGWLSV